MRERHGHEGERLSALLDDELTEPAALEVTRHLAVCDRCMCDLDDIRAARAALRGLPRMEPPAALLAGIVPGLAFTGHASRRLRVGSAVATGMLLTAAAAFVMGGSEPGTVVPPVERFVVEHVVQTGGGPVISPVDLGRPVSSDRGR